MPAASGPLELDILPPALAAVRNRTPKEIVNSSSMPPKSRKAAQLPKEVAESPSPEEIRDRLRRRAAFLRELAEARELRRRVAPRRSRRAALHATFRMRTFRMH